MATLKVVTRKANEYNPVYIRITQNSKSDYIRTEFTVHKSGINKKKEITDAFILSQCAVRIRDYYFKLNAVNSEAMSAAEIKKLLTVERDGISFSDFAIKIINQMWKDNRDKSASGYMSALNSLHKFFGRENLLFLDITAIEMRKWIKTLENTARAKRNYPAAIKKVFEDGCKEFNDYDKDIIRITNQPFRAVELPKIDAPRKRFADITTVKKILAVEPLGEREILAHDVSILILSLAGINTIDLYNLDKQDFKKGKFCYHRSKEMKMRKDKAYFEITVPEQIMPFLEKYKGEKKLFSFCERYSTADNFAQAIKFGLKTLCERAEVQRITAYWLRHTWATVARNECGRTMEEVAFCLNHASAHRVTEYYVEKDFKLVDIVNQQVIEKIFK